LQNSHKNTLKSSPSKPSKRLQEKMRTFSVRAVIFSTDSLAVIGLSSLFAKHRVELVATCTYDQAGFDLVVQEKPNLVIFVTNTHHPNFGYLESIKLINPTPVTLLIVSDEDRSFKDSSVYCDHICLSENFQSNDLTHLLREIGPQQHVSIRRFQGPPPKLTPSQTKVLELLSEGRKTPEIVNILKISRQAVDAQIKKLHQIFDSEDLHILVVLALRSGLVS
jgi:DNA-binding NarL/FixJ family response regulator